MSQVSSQTYSQQQQQIPSQYSPPSSPRAYRGVKRPAPDVLPDPEHQRLAKRFEILNLENANKLYIPVGSDDTPSAAVSHHASNGRGAEPPAEHMSVDSTPHRVYIADLDAELADSSPSPALCAYATGVDDDIRGPVFLPDIERQLSKIPAHVLRSPSARELARDEVEGEDLVPTKENQLILYGGPKEDDAATDSMRKAMIRAAIKERHARQRKASLGLDCIQPERTDARESEPIVWNDWTRGSAVDSPRSRPVSLEPGPDPMDMDVDEEL